ncbi:hypothetical protein SUGI_1042820 [Cryptomeria japonica]|nr:hypothetical protein SUGI_1042820 [Cryptomeria japonica]
MRRVLVGPNPPPPSQSSWTRGRHSPAPRRRACPGKTTRIGITVIPHIKWHSLFLLPPALLHAQKRLANLDGKGC